MRTRSMRKPAGCCSTLGNWLRCNATTVTSCPASTKAMDVFNTRLSRVKSFSTTLAIFINAPSVLLQRPLARGVHAFNDVNHLEPLEGVGGDFSCSTQSGMDVIEDVAVVGR